MSRRLWVAAAVAVPLLVLAVPSLYITAIILASVKVAGVATVLLLCAVGAVPAFCFWTEDAKPERNLSRAQRRRLREESQRIRLEAAIQAAEREAGIR